MQLSFHDIDRQQVRDRHPPLALAHNCERLLAPAGALKLSVDDGRLRLAGSRGHRTKVMNDRELSRVRLQRLLFQQAMCRVQDRIAHRNTVKALDISLYSDDDRTDRADDPKRRSKAA